MSASMESSALGSLEMSVLGSMESNERMESSAPEIREIVSGTVHSTRRKIKFGDTRKLNPVIFQGRRPHT
jgi:hypothetical protein